MCLKRMAWVGDRNHPSSPPHISKRKWLWICSIVFEPLRLRIKYSVSRDLRRDVWKTVLFENSYCWVCNSHWALGTACPCYFRTICLVRELSKGHSEEIDSYMSSHCWIYVWKNKNVLWGGIWLYAESLREERALVEDPRVLLYCSCPECVWAKDVYIYDD